MNIPTFFWMLGLLFLLCGPISSQSLPSNPGWRETWQKGKAAEEQKDLPAALQRYAESEKLAGTASERLSSIEAQLQILRRQQKQGASEKILREALQRGDFEAPQYRRLLNHLAGLLLWNAGQDEALDLLNQARFFAGGSENDRYATHSLSAHIYQSRGQHEAVIEIMRPWADNLHAHPANQYSAGMLVAKAWLKLGFPEKARKSYEVALAAGKKVKYRFNYSGAEKALQELSGAQ